MRKKNWFYWRVIEKTNDSEWGAPYFPQPKLKKNKVRFLSDFRNLNKQLKHKTYKMPKINEMLLKLEVPNISMSLHLSMRYCYILLCEYTSR